MIAFTPIASSSAGNAYLLESIGRPSLLLDAGVTFRRLREGVRYGITSLGACFLSHAHGDHARAIPELIRHGVKCYASEETWKTLGIEDYCARILESMQEVELQGWKVRAFDAVHDCRGTLGFVLTAGAEKCLYLTDSAYSRYLFEGLTHIFIECNHQSDLVRSRGSVQHRRTTHNHMSIDRLIEFLDKTDKSKLEEIHLLHLSDANSDEQAFKERVARATGVPVFVAAK